MSFSDKVKELLKPYQGIILNESGLDQETTTTIALGGKPVPTYERKSLLFFTTSPHLFLAAEVEGVFKHILVPYQKLDPEQIIKDVTAFAKSLHLPKFVQLDYVTTECKKLYEIIGNEFVEYKVEENIMETDFGTIRSRSNTSPFTMLENEVVVKGIFND